MPRTRIPVALLLILMLAGCGDDDSSPTTPPGSVGDSPVGAITNFVGGAFVNWGQAQFLTAIGLMPAPSTAEQLNEVLADLSQIQTEFGEAQAELQTLMGDFIDLQQQMSNDDFQAQAELLQSIASSEYANWNQFTNAVGTQTLPEVAGNPRSTGALVGLFTDSFLNQLATEAQELSNTAAPGDELNSTVPDYLTSAKNLLTATMATSQSESQNVVPVFDQYNNGLMNQYYYLVQALQQIYTIEQTVLYLQYNTTSFDEVTLAEPGVLDSNTYSQNYAVLQSLFADRLTQLCNLFSAAVVSDGAPPMTCGSAAADPPTRAATLPGVVGGPWVSSCDLYVWIGVQPPPESGFEGSWNGRALDAACDGVSYGLNLPSACGGGAQQVSFYAGPNAAGAQAGQLQCSGLNPTAYAAPGWNQGVGYAWGSEWSDHDSHANFGINTNGFGTSPPSTEPISGPLTYGVNWGANAAKLPGLSFSSVWAYTAPDGFVGAFAVLGTGVGGLIGSFGLNFQIQCIAGDPWCTQLAGQPSGGHLGQGESAICLAHQKITLTAQDVSSAAQALTFTGESC